MRGKEVFSKTVCSLWYGKHDTVEGQKNNNVCEGLISPKGLKKRKRDTKLGEFE